MNTAFCPFRINPAQRRSRNPGSFYFDVVEPSDWTTPENDALWIGERKTLFDPCPSGWQVPKGGDPADKPYPSPWKAFSVNNGDWESSGGRTFRSVVYGAAGTTWYPAAGYRRWNPGGLILVGTELGCFAASKADGLVHYLYSVANTVNPSGFSGGWPHPAIGFPVRCVRE
ncbi:MAG: hypothetical protein K2G93_06740 [Rikenella sp.]|nr:hypothetical protein [Rikenella sp.]